jgi:hypothetical protein
MTRFTVFATAIYALSVAPVLAGSDAPVPVPLAGAAGPVGIGIAIAGYIGYRLFRKKD